MNNRAIKMKITKILKNNGFSKSEIKKEWNHPKHKIAGFEYSNCCNGLHYYIPDNVFSNIEKEKFQKEKIKEMYKVLIDNGLEEYLKRYDYVIVWDLEVKTKV